MSGTNLLSGFLEWLNFLKKTDSLVENSNERPGRWEEDLDHCPECQKRFMTQTDKYCSYCGKKRSGKPGKHFVVSPDYMEVLYGPMPVTLIFSCPKCGIHWEGSNWDLHKYCPECGEHLIWQEEKPSKW